MTEQQFGPHSEKAGRGQAPAGAAGRSEITSSAGHGDAATTTTGTEGSASKRGAQAVVGTFTLRDLVVLGAVLVIFIGSLLPIFRAGNMVNLWNGASLFFVGIGIVLPLIVAGLFLARRLAARSTFRVGSLSVDQFGSVVASFAVAYFFLSIVSDFGLGFLIALIGSLALLAATVAAPWLPFFAADFAGRPESAAHPVARDAVLPVRKPAAAPKPAANRPTGSNAAGSAPVSTTAGVAASGPAATGSAASGSTATGSAVSATTGTAGAAASSQRGATHQPGATGATGRDNAGAHSSTTHPAGSNAAAADGPTSAAGRPAAETADTQHGPGAPTRAASSSSETADTQRAAGPARAASSSSETVAAAPELSQFLGGAAAGGAVAAAAQSLPAEGQTSEGNRAGSPAQQGSTGAGSRSSETLGARSDNEPKKNAGAQGTGADGASAAVEPVDGSLSGVPATTVNPTVQARRESIGATVDPASRSEAGHSHDQHGWQNEETGAESHSSAYDAFWFAVDRPRPVVDEKTGGFLYNVEPGNWILALQDRGHDFLVQNTDGRVGVLRDLRNIERAPEGE
ncbi:hypothetical protein IV498_01050 [Paenarthrobacter sp. Z7-10]|uniref:hypothetical protein n=1 Tax=Paenarthrobacter sp. Z7-10 TaxID=2787635 RepID=UPI0022A8E673|nr:hypothetical protein [Paenarthrobacter sp. Z7-10]MCZ2401806.1 hypothetical protein [Paenarthrobacter sp. Z7-10]